MKTILNTIEDLLRAIFSGSQSPSPLAEINARLDHIMTKAFHEVHDIWVRENKVDPLTMRQAAYILAVQRVAEAIRKRGIYP